MKNIILDIWLDYEKYHKKFQDNPLKPKNVSLHLIIFRLYYLKVIYRDDSLAELQDYGPAKLEKFGACEIWFLKNSKCLMGNKNSIKGSV